MLFAISAIIVIGLLIVINVISKEGYTCVLAFALGIACLVLGVAWEQYHLSTYDVKNNLKELEQHDLISSSYNEAITTTFHDFKDMPKSCQTYIKVMSDTFDDDVVDIMNEKAIIVEMGND